MPVLDLLGLAGLYYLNYGKKKSCKGLVGVPNTQDIRTAKNLHQYSLSQEERYRFTLELIENFPDEVAPHIPSYQLTLEQEKEVALRLAKDGMANISHDIHHFCSLGHKERKEIALQALKTHPTKVYESLANYDFIDCAFITEHLTAYFTLENLLPRLERGEPVLEKVLACVQQITRKSSLPETFLRKVERVIEKKLKIITHKTVIELVHMLNQYPSAVTLSLVTLVQKRVSHLFPKLSDYCYSEMGFVQLNGRGFDFLARSIEGVHIYKTVYVVHLPEAIHTFLKNKSLKKAVIPIAFSDDLTGHFCPLYLEKTKGGELRVFLSDSTGEVGTGKFPREVIPLLADLPIKDLYVLHIQRQFFPSVCSLFALNDIIEIVQCGDIFSVLEKEVDILETQLDTIKYKQVMSLPVGMMKMTQLTTKVKKYITEKGNHLMQASHLPGMRHEAIDLKSFSESCSHYSMDILGQTERQNKFSEWCMARIFELFLHESIH